MFLKHIAPPLLVFCITIIIAVLLLVSNLYLFQIADKDNILKDIIVSNSVLLQFKRRRCI